MERQRFPVFQSFQGPAEAPSEAWAIRTLGYEGQPAPAWHLAAFVDEVASGVAIVGATPQFEHLADGAAPVAIENLRRLDRLVLERAPSVTVDPETRALLQGRPPQAFAGMNQFTSFDSCY